MLTFPFLISRNGFPLKWIFHSPIIQVKGKNIRNTSNVYLERNTYLIATLACVLLATASCRRASYSRSRYENYISFVIVLKLEPETDQIGIKLVVL